MQQFFLFLVRALAVAGTLSLFSCSSLKPKNGNDVFSDASVKVVTARLAGGGQGPQGITDRFTTDGVVYAFVSIVWPPEHVGLGEQKFESRWYSGDRLVVQREVTLTVTRSPFNFWSSVFPVNLSAGVARYELYSGGRKLAEKSFEITAPI